MAPLVKFTVLRIALFVVVLAVLSLLGARGWLLLLLAAVISLGLSYVLLRGPREELAEALAQRSSTRGRRRSRTDEVAEDEDAGNEDR